MRTVLEFCRRDGIYGKTVKKPDGSKPKRPAIFRYGSKLIKMEERSGAGVKEPETGSGTVKKKGR